MSTSFELDEKFPGVQPAFLKFMADEHPNVEVLLELDENSESALKAVDGILLYNFQTSDDDFESNGPGLFSLTLSLALITAKVSDNLVLREAIHKTIKSWNRPGRGWQPGVGGFVSGSVETQTLFNETYTSQLIGKRNQESQASYTLRFRSLTN